MIPAHKRPAFNFLLRRWLTAMVRRRFYNVYVAGGQHLAGLTTGEPVIGCVNHTNWWDGFVLYLLSHRALPHEIYLAMEEKNLRRYPFLAWMGAFGVDLEQPGSALPGVRYALRLLRGASAGSPRLMWLFVQGKLLRPTAPVEIRGGATFLAAHAKATLLPLVIRYEWQAESRPSVFIRVGVPLPHTTAPATLAAALNGLLTEIDAGLDKSTVDEYVPWFEPAMSMNKRWDHFVHRLLRRGGEFDPRNQLDR